MNRCNDSKAKCCSKWIYDYVQDDFKPKKRDEDPVLAYKRIRGSVPKRREIFKNLLNVYFR